MISLKNKERGSITIITFILLLSSFIGVSSVFPSPYIDRPNYQVSNMDLDGMTWFYDHKSTSIENTQLRMTSVYANAILGVNKRKNRIDIEFGTFTAPSHFNFGNNTSTLLYMPISLYDKLFYTKLYKDLENFNEIDFERLYQDPPANILYSNSELEIFLIKRGRY